LHNEEAINNRRHGLPNDSERKAVYLDVCALLRPYDDQSQMRVSMETDAVNMILVAAKERKVILRTSPVHAVELQESVGDEENIATLELLGDIATPIIPSKATRARAEFWADQGIGLGDAAHLAFAESAGADFITCDDRLIKRVLKSGKAAVWVGNPVGYCEKELLK
jgi:predicted nucleic acid-binding protein